MLVSSCCKNYLCRLCIGEMAKKAKSNRDYVINCTHCLANDFKLDDVKPEAEIKYYTDSPFKFNSALKPTKKGSPFKESPIKELSQEFNISLIQEAKARNQENSRE